MSGYRPICDTWILARPKVKYYGAYPSGFLHRARALLGVGPHDAVLHVCAGKVRDYPFRGFGPNDQTLDLDPATEPDFWRDAREPFPFRNDGESARLLSWHAVLIDRPYTPEDAAHYAPGPDALPTANQLIRHALNVVPVGHRVGILDYVWPQPPKHAVELATVGVTCGRNNRIRQFTVIEKLREA